MALILDGGTGITTPDINTTAITATGDISAVNVTTSGGVYVGGAVAANYLDDYEEGTWTPEFTDDSGNSLYADNNAFPFHSTYTKIGRLVHYSAYIVNDESFTYGSGISSTTHLHISGLPFTPAGQYSGHCGYFTNWTNWSTGYIPMLITVANQPRLAFYYAGANGVTQVFAQYLLATNSTIAFSGSYVTSS